MAEHLRLFASCAGAVVFLAAALPAGASATKTVCGTRTGTAGNAALTDARGEDVIILATQGADQHLLDAADALLPPRKAGGEAGTQNGQKYCLTVRYDGRGNPQTVVSARRQR